MLTNRWTWFLILVAALLATVTIQNRRLATEQQRTASLALRASNEEAARDTTRELAPADSARTFTKHAVQRPQSADAVDKTLSAEHVASYAMAVRVDTVRIEAELTPDTSSHRAHFAVRQEPYTVAADVDRASAADTGTLHLSIALDPIPLSARVECGVANADGIRPASIAVAAPPWSSIALQRLEQSSEVCASPALRGAPRRHIEFSPLVVGAGRLIDVDRSSWGVFIGSGVRIQF